MRAGIEQSVRYWAFLFGKLCLAALMSGALLWMANLFWDPHVRFFQMVPYLFGFDLAYTTVTGLIFLAAYGLVHLAFLDQRYRCRVCLRRLRMPIETGSWSGMLRFGRPRMEYICIYGHGKLNVEQIQFTGMEYPKWKQHQDMWSELQETRTADRDR